MAEEKRQRQGAFRRSLRNRGAVLGLGGVAVVSILLAGCGGTASTHTASAPPATHTAPSSSQTAKQVVISTSKSATFGTILVSGNTLYTLKPSKTACTAQCMKIWPAAVLPQGVTAATAGPGVKSSKLGTVTRANGVHQVTYAGQALYHFVKDTAPGQVNGNVTDTWGKWSDVATAGTGPTATKSPSATTTVPKSGGAGF